MVFEYWTFGNADAVIQLLNAVAAITATGSDYGGLIKTAALLGFLVIVTSSMLKADPRGIVTWFIAIALGWYVLFVPRVTMAIQDHSGMGTSVRTVGNVPLGLGFIASAGSSVGRWLTDKAETVFSLPDRATFINGGLMAPHRVSLATLNYSMVNQTLASDWMNFLRDCTYFDVNVYSKRYGYTWALSADELANSSNPLESLGKTNNVMFVNIHTGGSQTLTCRDAYNVLKTATELEAQSSLVQRRYAMKAFPGMDEAQAVTAFQNAVEDAQDLLYRAPIATHQVITNRWVHNLLRMEGTRNAVSAGNTAQAVVEFGAIQAEQGRLNAYLQSARAAHDTVPSIRNVVESVTIGLFPLVLIVLVVTGLQGIRAFVEWALFYFSLQLWGFCYALMNYFLISKTGSNIYAIVNSNDASDISLATMGEVAEEITADMAMAGTMVWAIPAICYALTKGAGMGLASMASRLAAPAQGGAEKVGDQTGTGNIRSGEGRFATSSASNSLEVGGESGRNLFYTGGGSSLMNGPRVAFSGYSSSAPVGLSTAMTNSATLSAASSATAETSRQLSTQASQTRQAAISDAVSTALKSSNTSAIDKQWQSQGQGSFSQGAGSTQKLVDAISQSTGASQEQAMKLAMEAGVGSGKLVSPVNIGAQIGKTYGATAKSNFEGKMGSEGSRNVQQASEFVQTMSTSQSARETAMGGRDSSKGVEARLTQANALEQASQNAYRESQGLQQQAQAVASGQSSLNMDLTKASPELAQRISGIAQSPEFQLALNSGNTQEATAILARGLAANFSDSPGSMAQVLDNLAIKPEQAPALASGPAGGSVPARRDLQDQYQASAAATAAGGEADVNSRWAQRPDVSVGGPSVGEFAGSVEAGQASVRGSLSEGHAAVAAGQASRTAEVQPELPGMKAGGLTQPKSQTRQVSQMLGNDAANTVSGVMKFGASAASELLGSGPVQGAVNTVRKGSEATLKASMNAPASVANAVTSVQAGPKITFPYSGNDNDDNSGNSMAYVNQLRAEKGLPPFASSADQIPK